MENNENIEQIIEQGFRKTQSSISSIENLRLPSMFSLYIRNICPFIPLNSL